MIRVGILLLVLAIPVGSNSPLVVNDFAKAYNYWVSLMNTRTSNLTVNAREIRAWKDTQDKWKTLDKYVNYK